MIAFAHAALAKVNKTIVHFSKAKTIGSVCVCITYNSLLNCFNGVAQIAWVRSAETQEFEKCVIHDMEPLGTYADIGYGSNIGSGCCFVLV